MEKVEEGGRFIVLFLVGLLQHGAFADKYCRAVLFLGGANKSRKSAHVTEKLVVYHRRRLVIGA